MWIWFLGREDPLAEEMATHSSILAWRIPWTEEPDGLQSMGLQSQTWLSAHARTHTHTHTHWNSLICWGSLHKATFEYSWDDFWNILCRSHIGDSFFYFLGGCFFSRTPDEMAGLCPETTLHEKHMHFQTLKTSLGPWNAPPMRGQGVPSPIEDTACLTHTWTTHSCVELPTLLKLIFPSPHLCGHIDKWI